MDDLIILCGNLGRDPKVKYTDKGAVSYFNMAINKHYGEEKRTIWFTIQSLGKLAERVGNNLTKGRRVLVRGNIEVGINKEQEQYMFIRAKEIKFLDRKAS